MPKNKSKPIGRPLWIPDEETLKKVEHYASRGLTHEQIADCLGICAGTLYEKKKDYIEFSEAIKRGRSKGIAHVANKLLANVDIGNVPAQIFYLKCIGKWHDGDIDKNNADLSGKIANAIADVLKTYEQPR